MRVTDLQTSMKADPDFDFDRFLEWRTVEGRMALRLRRDAGIATPAEANLHFDATALFSDPSPCLDRHVQNRFDILCEGDSWFCLSIYGPGHVTMVQHLARMGYLVCNVAKYSRSSHELWQRRNAPTGYRTKLAARPKVFLVSSGGIDFLGDAIHAWLLQRASGDHDPKHAKRYLDGRQFDLILNVVRQNYRNLIQDVDTVSPNTTLLFHTYGYAEPTHTEGNFLGKYFVTKGFDPIDSLHRPLISAIMRLAIDRFHALLEELRREHPDRIRIVDFRPLLGIDDFRDEIHPRPAMAPAMAELYIPHLEAAGVEPRAPVA